MKQFTKVMKALSDPNRVKVVKMLGQREALCVCEITAALGLAQPTVSKHLKVLEDAGLVESSREGAWVNYRLGAAHGAPYADAMLVLLRDWLQDDAETTAVLSRISGINRQTLCVKKQG